MESTFDTGASIVGLAFALGIGVLLLTFVVRSWVRTYPWSLLAVALFAAYLLWEGIRDRRRNSKPVTTTIKEFAQGLAIVLVVCAMVTVVLETIVSNAADDSVKPRSRPS